MAGFSFGRVVFHTSSPLVGITSTARPKLNLARPGRARLGAARIGWERHGEVSRGMARLAGARQGKDHLTIGVEEMDKNDARQAALEFAAWQHFEGANLKRTVESALDFYDEAISTLDKRDNPPIDNGDKRFKIFNNLRYQGQPDLRGFGLTPCKIWYASELWPSGVPKAIDINRTFPRVELIDRLGFNLHPGLNVIDIEHWWPPDHTGREPMDVKAVQNYVNLIKHLRGVSTRDQQIALYGTLTRRNYWDSVRVDGDPNKTKWKRSNSAAFPIAQHVDASCPSLYTFYNDSLAWRTYAVENISEAKRIAPNVPCYPYLWPEYHSSNDELKGTPIDPVFWRTQLQTCMDMADGCVIWTHSDVKRVPWADIPPWWQETVKFARDHQLV